METNTHKKSPLLFDADAEQGVELLIQYRGVERTVAHRFAPLTDELFFHFEQRKKTRARVSGQDLLTVRNEDQEVSAAEWLWNELALGRDGYVTRDDWRERTNVLDKAQAIRDGLLAVYAVRGAVVTSIDPSEMEPVDDDLGTEIALDCLFNSTALTVRHAFRAPSAADVKEYDRLMRIADNLIARGGRRPESAQVVIPSKARELAALYDRLAVGADGYAARVPAHHKREAVLELFSREARVTEKK
jgi:hypothetical protein